MVRALDPAIESEAKCGVPKLQVARRDLTMFRHASLALLIAISCVAGAENVRVPADTRVYLELTETVVGKKGKVAVGDIVRARVWRDVLQNSRIVIEAGTTATLRVSTFEKSKVFGRKGELELAAIETQSTDNQIVPLSGGYGKEGKSRMGWALGVGILVLWPVLFLKGKAAELPAGTVIDTYMMRDLVVSIPDATGARVTPTVNLTGLLDEMSVTVLYERLKGQEKPEFFDFRIVTREPVDSFVIDSVNGDPVDAIELETIQSAVEGDQHVTEARAKIKALARHLRRGINRFDVAYTGASGRVGTEVILEIQI